MTEDAASSVLEIEISGRRFVLQQRPRSLDHAFCVWDAGIGWARYAERQRRVLERMRGRRVCELGAGLCLVSMVCAAAGARVVATDLPHCLPHMASIVAANGLRGAAALGAAAGGAEEAASLDVAALAWGEAAAVDELVQAQGGAFDFVIGTDVVYQDCLVRPLLRTAALLALTARRGGQGGECAGKVEDHGYTVEVGDESGALAPPPLTRPTTVIFANEARDEGTSALFASLFDALFQGKLVPSKLYGEEARGTSLRIYEGKLRTGLSREEILAATA